MRKEVLAPLAALVLGAGGFALRKWELATAFEADTGLPIDGAPATMALIVLSVVMAVVLALLCRGKYPAFTGYDQAFQAKGYPMRYDSPTNQLFPVLPDAHLAKLADRHVWSFWEKVDADHTAVRFCTSWCTTDAQVAQLVADLAEL